MNMIFVYFYSTSYTADIRLPIYIRIYQQFTHNMHIILPICKYTKYFRTTKKYLLSRRYYACFTHISIHKYTNGSHWLVRAAG